MKRCSRCNAPKPATHEYFEHRAASADGLTAQCRVCLAAKRRGKAREKRKHTDADLELGIPALVTVEVHCRNDGCPNSRNAEIEEGTRKPTYVCDYCKENGCPDHRSWGLAEIRAKLAAFDARSPNERRNDWFTGRYVTDSYRLAGDG